MIAPIPSYPPHGIHRDIPSATYHGWPLPSASRLKVLAARTPKHLLHQMSVPKDSRALRIGRAAHSLILQPERFDSEFAVAPDLDRRTKEGKAAYAEHITSAAGKDSLSQDEFETARDIADAFTTHKLGRSLLAKCPDRELSIVADVHGYPVKVRPDAVGELLSGKRIVLEIKTTTDASLSEFERAIANFGYGIQAALITRGLEAAGCPVEDFLFGVVESEPPHDVAVYRMDDRVIELFDERLPELLRTWHDCYRLNEWPGLPPEITTVGVPIWMRRRMEEVSNGN